MMANRNVLVGTAAGIMTITMDRQERKNAINLAMYEALADALAAAGSDSGVRVVLLEGAGGNFSSGNDLLDFLDPTAFGPGKGALRFIDALVETRKPLVAAVEGLAVGIGVTMLLHCDLVWAGEGARFQLPFVNLGLCPEAGSSQLLPLAAGPRKAAELLLLGEVFDARAAQEAGIVNSVVPTGKAGAVAREKAARLVAQPASALRTTKELLRRGDRATLQATIALEAERFGAGLSSPEAAEAFAAFASKRKPDFSRFS